MLYSVVYLVSIVVANLLVSHFGPKASIVVAFVFIGLDLTLRDSLHEQWKNSYLFPKMLGLLFLGSAISFAINYKSLPIALASFAAFSAAGIVDFAVYSILVKKDKTVKVNGSNIFSSLADSLVFPVVAFGFPILWWVIIGQFLAKTVGGFFWYILIAKVAHGLRRTD